MMKVSISKKSIRSSAFLMLYSDGLNSSNTTREAITIKTKKIKEASRNRPTTVITNISKDNKNSNEFNFIFALTGLACSFLIENLTNSNNNPSIIRKGGMLK